MKLYLLTWIVSEKSGVKVFNCDLNLGENQKEAIHNQMKKNAKKGLSSYDYEVIEVEHLKSVFATYGFKLVKPKTVEKEIKPKIEKHSSMEESEK